MSNNRFPSVFVFVLFAILWAMFFVLVGSASAQGLDRAAPAKRACTLSDPAWLAKLPEWLGGCNALGADMPVVIPMPQIDPVKWAEALKQAEQWLRDHKPNYANPLVEGNPINEIGLVAFRYYCNLPEDAQYQPHFKDGQPVCPVAK